MRESVCVYAATPEKSRLADLPQRDEQNQLPAVFSMVSIAVCTVRVPIEPSMKVTRRIPCILTAGPEPKMRSILLLIC